MPITHYWDGTKLVVTSDSGTSSADLKGEIGIRGPQGPAGFLVDREGVEIDSKNLALKSEIPTIVANPSEDATTELTKVTINDTIYSLQSGDVTAAGDNTFTGLNTFTNTALFKYESSDATTKNYITVDPINGKLAVENGGSVDSPTFAIEIGVENIKKTNPGGTYTYGLPSVSGTIALVSDIPNGIVSATENNTFTGINHFMGNRVYFGAGITTPGTDDFLVDGSYNISLPAKAGTVALLDDITSAINNAVVSVINTEA